MGVGGWILLGVVASAIGTTFALLLLRMASDEDRAARQEKKAPVPAFGRDHHAMAT